MKLFKLTQDTGCLKEGDVIRIASDDGTDTPACIKMVKDKKGDYKGTDFYYPSKRYMEELLND